MVKISELPIGVRRAMVEDISKVMRVSYNIGKESIFDFWETVGIGIEVKKRA